MSTIAKVVLGSHSQPEVVSVRMFDALKKRVLTVTH